MIFCLDSGSTPEVVSEAYFGKSPILQQAENVLEQMRQEILQDPYADYTNHKLNEVFQKLIEKQFGWKKFHCIWEKTARSQANAYTLLSVDVLRNPREMVSVNKKNGFYDKSHSHIAYVAISATMVQQLGLTAAEMLAIMLHEFGHNFDVSPYMCVNMLGAYGKEVSKLIEEALSNDPKQNPKEAEKALQKLIPNTGNWKDDEAHWGRYTSKELSTPFMKRALKMWHDVIDGMSKARSVALYPFRALINLPIYAILSPVDHRAKMNTRKGETFADSFAVAYGYGPELASGLNKLGVGSFHPEKHYFRFGIRRFATDMIMAQRYMITLWCGSCHGTHDTRMFGMIRQLENELKDETIPASLRKELANQVQELKDEYDRYMRGEMGDTNLIMTSLMRKAVATIFNGESDFVAKIFPENTINNRFESADGEVSAHGAITDLYVTGYSYMESYVEACEQNNLDKIRLYENRLKYIIEAANEIERMTLEAANIDKDMKPIIDQLNAKGYKTKYSSAGHTKLRKKEDRYKDGIYKGKLYSDARIMFDGDYNFPKAPKYWIWKSVEGNDYLDIDPKQYTPEKTAMTPDQEFSRWKACYMGTLKTWVDNLPDADKADDSTEVKDTKGRDVAVEDVEIPTVDEMMDTILESVLFDVTPPSE